MKNVLILGANSDMAKSLAYKFAKEGYNLQLAARNHGPLKRLQSDIKLRFDKTVDFYEYDATDFNMISDFLSKLKNKPDVVIMAVGLFYTQSSIENNSITDPVKAKNLTLTNFLGPALILENIAAELSKSNNPTAIIGISSVAGDRGRAKNYWYGASKAGFSAFLSGLRQKYIHTKLLVMTVKPGFVATKMLQGEQTPKLLTLHPDQMADLIFSSMNKRKAVIYHWKWLIIMIIIKTLPEKFFSRLKF